MSTEAKPYCPCGGVCHHSKSLCSLGCWAAQQPWRTEEAVAARNAEIAAAVRGLPGMLGYLYVERAAVLALIEP